MENKNKKTVWIEQVWGSKLFCKIPQSLINCSQKVWGVEWKLHACQNLRGRWYPGQFTRTDTLRLSQVTWKIVYYLPGCSGSTQESNSLSQSEDLQILTWTFMANRYWKHISHSDIWYSTSAAHRTPKGHIGSSPITWKGKELVHWSMPEILIALLKSEPPFQHPGICPLQEREHYDAKITFLDMRTPPLVANLSGVLDRPESSVSQDNFLGYRQRTCCQGSWVPQSVLRCQRHSYTVWARPCFPFWSSDGFPKLAQGQPKLQHQSPPNLIPDTTATESTTPLPL